MDFAPRGEAKIDKWMDGWMDGWIDGWKGSFQVLTLKLL